MKKLDLNKYGVQEMNAVEMRETDGGWVRIATFVLWALAWELVTEGIDKCVADFKAGYNSTQNNQ